MGKSAELHGDAATGLLEAITQMSVEVPPCASCTLAANVHEACGAC